MTILKLSKFDTHLAKTVEKPKTVGIKPVTIEQPNTATKLQKCIKQSNYYSTNKTCTQTK